MHPNYKNAREPGNVQEMYMKVSTGAISSGRSMPDASGTKHAQVNV